MAMLPKVVYRFYAIPIKMPMVFFIELKKKFILKSSWKHKRPQIAQAVLNKKNNACGLKISDCKLHQSHTDKNRHVD
jgi:hypothetical protein